MPNPALRQVVFSRLNDINPGNLELEFENIRRRLDLNEFDVSDYRAVPGETDSYAKIQRAIDDAEAENGGVINLRDGVYNLSQPLTVESNYITIRGKGKLRTTLKSAADDVITLGTSSANIAHFTMTGMRLWSASGGGHVINIPFGLGQSVLNNLYLQQDNTGKNVIRCVRTVTGGGLFDNHFTDSYYKHSASATVPGVYIANDGTAGNICSANVWRRLRVQLSGDYFFWLENQRASNWLYGNTFSDINFEQCDKGGIKLYSCMSTLLERLSFHDNGTITKDNILLGRNSTTPPQCRNTTIINYLRTQGTLSSAVDIKEEASNTLDTLYLGGPVGPSASSITIDLGTNARSTLVGYSSDLVTINNASTSRVSRMASDKGAILPLLTLFGWLIQDEIDSNPTTAELDANDSIAVYSKADTFVIAYNNAGTMTYLTIPLDGSTTTWTHGTSAP